MNIPDTPLERADDDGAVRDIRGRLVRSEEGEPAVGLPRELACAGVAPDLYVITPFVVVQDSLRRVIRGSGVLEGWTDDPWARERVGTVHVVQGREAEAVILVLGAPDPAAGGGEGLGRRPAEPAQRGGEPGAGGALRGREPGPLWREAGLFRELDARLPG